MIVLSRKNSALIIAGTLVFILLLLKLYSNWTASSLIFISLISLAVIFSFYSYTAVVVLMILTIPLSVNTRFFSSASVLFPSEMLVGLLTLIFFSRLLIAGELFSFSKSFLKNSVTVFVLLYFGTLILSAIFSTMPSVSIKTLLVRFCYISVFYFLMHRVFKSIPKSKEWIYLAYSCSLFFVIAYASVKHVSLGIAKSNAALSVIPFYNDHTMYSAAISFLIPALLAFVLFPATFSISKPKQLIIFFLVLLFITGLCLSYCRAAWISVVAALILFFLIQINFRFYSIIALLCGIIIIAAFNSTILIEAFRENKFDSNVKNASFIEQTRSITNITNDVSNAERLNRWSCALRMFGDKPFTGFGPGTYQFQYLPYQRKEEMTPISVTSPYNAPLGHGGSTHSEYFVSLSESGIFSLIAFIGLLVASLYTGLKVFSKSPDKKTRVIACFVMLGLVTYFTHGLFNNFLENDKLAFLFWSSLSILATLDSSSAET
jgi:putative inorganic carbon (HCO3(-)) transporter